MLDPVVSGADTKRIGVLLMTFGSPATIRDVPRYLASVRGGRVPDSQLVKEFQRRYRLIGGSPLLAHTQEQAVAVARALADRDPAHEYRVAVGMRHSAPSIADGVAQLASEQSERIVGLVLSPQFSPGILGGYLREFGEAMDRFPNVARTLVGSWHLNRHFIAALAHRLTEVLRRFPEGERERIPVIFTAHSMPRAVADREPDYIDQLKATAFAVASAAGLISKQWQFAYQSAGHTPDAWLTPDIADLFPRLRAEGHTSVVIAPIQFLSDHLEVLYDIDIAARAQATQAGLRLERTESLNASSDLGWALADAVLAALAAEVRV
jgi:ferrochelatase